MSLDQIHGCSIRNWAVHITLFQATCWELGSSNPHREYVFRLTGGGVDGTEVHYGVCLQTTVLHRRTHFDGVIDKRAEMQRCVCIISRYPFISFFLQILRDLVQLLNRDDMNKLLFDEVVASYVGGRASTRNKQEFFLSVSQADRRHEGRSSCLAPLLDPRWGRIAFRRDPASKRMGTADSI